MRIRYDPHGDGALYLRVREGDIEETLELGGGCYLDVGADGTVMGLECLSLDEFRELIERSGGELNLPERVEDFDSPLDLGRSRPPTYEHVHRAMSELPSRQQEVLRLRYMEGLDNSEVAERLGVSYMTVVVLHRKALEGLRRALEEREPGLAHDASLEAFLSRLH